MKTKTLIIPDIHLQWEKVDAIIEYEAADNIIFLGDHFDDFGDDFGDDYRDDYRDNVIMAEWLAASLEQPNRIHLLGNHDIGYAISQRSYKCSGYEAGKDYGINAVLKKEDWQKIKLYTWMDNWLLSHAGVHPYFYDKYLILEKEAGNNSPKEFKYWLEDTCNTAMENAWLLKPADPILRAGRSRGGIEPVGGIMWCDATEFKPTPGINQIFGHTPSHKPYFINDGDPITPAYSRNLALDNRGHSNYYAIYENNDVTVKWVGDM